MMMLAFRTITITALALAFSGCSPASDRTDAKAHQAAVLSDQEDPVCGMMVHEMSAPRAQVVHRDGSRFFFCSLGDMLIHLSAPSPHGRVEATFVEVMKPDEDPMQSHTGDHPWMSAKDAVFVIGIDRPGIMGTPILSYADRDEGERVTTGRSGTQQLDLKGLKEWWDARSR